jgi:hypothetical protein
MDRGKRDEALAMVRATLETIEPTLGKSSDRTAEQSLEELRRILRGPPGAGF